MLLKKLKKKISLLKEQHKSWVNHYVTKGVDTNVELKNSGIDWIGKIPKHPNWTRRIFYGEN